MHKKIRELLTELEEKRRKDLAPESQDLMEDSSSEGSGSEQDPQLAAMLDIVGEASGGTDPTLLQSVKTVVNKEMKDYQNAAALVLQTSPGVWSNPLDWWRANHHKFPLHAQLARIHLATQATSAPSERVFSVASRCISKVRTNMD